jgi:DNA-binding response OmpR family regulator
MPARLLSISVDRALLMQRHLMLQEIGYDVASAADMPELIIALSQGPFDLVILGHSLPPKEKLRIFHLIRANSERTPIVELYVNSPDLDTGHSLHSQASPEQLVETVRNALGESDAQEKRIS